MSLFDLFNSKRTSQLSKNVNGAVKNDQEKILKADAQIVRLQKANEQYEKDGNLAKKIASYENLLDLNRPLLWNSFNYCLSLVKMYVSADRKDDAWRFLNQMSLAFVEFPAYEDYLAKIRNEQFKILKGEKKFKDALQMLAVSHVLKTNFPDGTHFDEEKFIKDAKTTAKGAGLSPDDLQELAALIKHSAKKKKNTEKQIIELYREFISQKNL